MTQQSDGSAIQGAPPPRHKDVGLPRTGLLTGVLDLLAKIALLGGPIFYALGRVYAEGYWNELGVAPNVMGVDAEDYIYLGVIFLARGLILVLPSGSHWTIWLSVLLPFLAIFLLTGIILVFNRVKSWAERKLRGAAIVIGKGLTPEGEEAKALHKAAAIYEVVNTGLIYFLIFSTALLAPLWLSLEVGKGAAQSLRERLANGEVRSTVVTVNAPSPFSAGLIDCNDRFCTVYADRRFQIAPIEAIDWNAQPAGKGRKQAPARPADP